MKAKVESGLYNNASEVVRETPRFMDTHEQWIHEIRLAKLREQLQVGISQLDQGLGIPVGGRPELDAIFSEIQGDPKA